MKKRRRQVNGQLRLSGFLARLARDTAGNTLTIMAAAIIPLAGLIGGGVDMSRIYLTKTRLQQACDAGTLAGRKVMGTGLWTANSNAANTAAERFFDSNFAANSYGSGNRARAFTNPSVGRVRGTASVTLPMTIMKVFGVGTKTIAVTCDAEMSIPNTDVMFVLDTTGSMAQTTPDGVTKIAGLRRAVKCFYESMQKVDTAENCPGPAPSGGIGNQVQLRFGFVPFATNVNVGKLLPEAYFANSWDYQSRVIETHMVNTTPATWTNGTATVSNTNTNNGNWSSWVNNGSQFNNGSSNCPTPPVNTFVWNTEGAPFNQNTSVAGNGVRTVTWETNQTGTETDYRYDQTGSSPNKRCQPQRRTRSVTVNREYIRTDQPATWNQVPEKWWHYQKRTLNISGLKSGNVATPWVPSTPFTLPIGNRNGAGNETNKPINWDGCIEERPTVKNVTDFSTIPSNAYDLDINLVPTQGNANSLWGPALDDVIYTRNGSSYTTATDSWSTSDWSSFSYSCPSQAKKLVAYPTNTAFESYVNGLSIGGRTYHDIGLLWGARFLSPTGIFASENAATPGGAPIDRHLIFMTDGEVCTQSEEYTAYGIAWFDKRQTDLDASLKGTRCSSPYNASSNPNPGGPLVDQVIARYQGLCTAVKNMNITLWVIYYGVVDGADETRMRACATDNDHFFNSTDSDELLNDFKTIADAIGQLRLTT